MNNPLDYEETEISILNDVYIITGGRFNSALEFSEHIIASVYRNDSSYMEEVIGFCQTNDIDIENIKPIVHQTLKESLYAEAVKGNMIKSQTTVVPLPF